jgi:hypothetical protein
MAASPNGAALQYLTADLDNSCGARDHIFSISVHRFQLLVHPVFIAAPAGDIAKGHPPDKLYALT